MFPVEHLNMTKEVILMDSAARLHEKEIEFEKQLYSERIKLKEMVLHYEEKHQSLNNEINQLKSEKMSSNDVRSLRSGYFFLISIDDFIFR